MFISTLLELHSLPQCSNPSTKLSTAEPMRKKKIEKKKGVHYKLASGKLLSTSSQVTVTSSTNGTSFRTSIALTSVSTDLYTQSRLFGLVYADTVSPQCLVDYKNIL